MCRRLCIVSSSFRGGGAQRVAVNLANHFHTLGHEVTLIVFQDEGPFRSMVSPGVRVVRLEATRSAVIFRRLLTELRKERPDAVLSVMRSTNIFVGVAARLAGTGRVILREASTLQSVTQRPFLKRLPYLTAMRLSYLLADAVIANSEGTARDLVAHRIGRRRDVVVVPNPVLDADVDSLMAQSVGHPWLDDQGTKVVLAVGRLVPSKNYPMLLHAFSKVLRQESRARMIILGEGPELGALQALQVDFGLADFVEIIPFQDNPFPYYAGADAFALTSDWEGFGNVLVEALAAGTPVVSTDCPGGPREILADGAFGALVPPRDASAMANALLATLEQPVDHAVLKERAAQFTVEVCGARYLDIMTGSAAPEPDR
ncbi:MAG: glycosyltransferase [Dehalococcoidia bacterium]